MKAESHDPADRKTFLSMLKNTTSTDDVRHVEAKAAQEFWRQWIGVQLSFKGPGVSDEWRIFPGRYIGRISGGTHDEGDSRKRSRSMLWVPA